MQSEAGTLCLQSSRSIDIYVRLAIRSREQAYIGAMLTVNWFPFCFVKTPNNLINFSSKQTAPTHLEIYDDVLIRNRYTLFSRTTVLRSLQNMSSYPFINQQNKMLQMKSSKLQYTVYYNHSLPFIILIILSMHL